MHVNQVRQAFFPQLEEVLHQDILIKRQAGTVINGTYILNKARLIAQELALANFIGSRGWLLNFLKRHGLVLRRITSGGKQLPINTKDIINEFHLSCVNSRVGRKRAEIFNIDETSIQLDAPGNYTYDTKGTKNVYGNTPGHEKVKISISLIAAADGSLLSPVVIIPRVNPLKNYTVPSNVIVYYKKGSKTFDSNVITEGVIRRALFPHLLRNNLKRPLLFIDSAPCHLTTQVRDELNHHNIDTIVVPPRMTNLLQPLDVSIMKSFKSKYHAKWTDWYLNSDKSFTRNGNMRSPPYATIIDWISSIVIDIPRELVSNSFDVCGITQNNNENYHSALSYVMSSNVLPVTILDELDGTEDMGEMFVGEEDEEMEDSDSETIVDDDSEIESGKKIKENLISNLF